MFTVCNMVFLYDVPKAKLVEHGTVTPKVLGLILKIKPKYQTIIASPVLVYKDFMFLTEGVFKLESNTLKNRGA